MFERVSVEPPGLFACAYYRPSSRQLNDSEQDYPDA